MAPRRDATESVQNEWVGAIVAPPVELDRAAAAKANRFPMLVWRVVGGPVLEATVGQSEADLVVEAGELLRSAIESPSVEGVTRPTFVRVSSPILAEALRADPTPDVEIVCGPTPELEQIIAAMRAYFVGGDD